MLKLYRLEDKTKDYWEMWEEAPGRLRVHWGTLGTTGESKVIESTFFKSAVKVVEKDVDEQLAQGFEPIEPEDHAILLIEYEIDGMGSPTDLETRHALEDRMNE